MGFLGAIGRAVKSPFKAVGNVARGRWKAALGNIADLGQVAAPVLAATGVGAPLAMGIGAASGALKRGTEEGATLKNVLGGAAKGAAVTGASAIGGNLLRGAGGASTFGASKAGDVASRSIGRRLLGAGGDVLSFAKENPELAASVAGTAADVYGAGQEGAALDRAYTDQRADELRRQERQENVDPILAKILEDLMRQPRAA